jgi:hypothetical protein
LQPRAFLHAATVNPGVGRPSAEGLKTLRSVTPVAASIREGFDIGMSAAVM